MGKALEKIEFLTFGTLTHPNIPVGTVAPDIKELGAIVKCKI